MLFRASRIRTVLSRKQFRTPATRCTGLPVSAYGQAVVWPHGGWSGGYSIRVIAPPCDMGTRLTAPIRATNRLNIG